jgi:outer membrane protein OmpA-like peptidoglycan-associated protein
MSPVDILRLGDHLLPRKSSRIGDGFREWFYMVFDVDRASWRSSSVKFLSYFSVDHFRFWISVIACLVVLLCMVWPRDTSGAPKSYKRLLVVTLLLAVATIGLSLGLKRQNDFVLAAQLQHLRESNDQLNYALTDSMGRLNTANAQIEVLERSASEQLKVSAEKEATLENQLKEIASSAKTNGRTLELQFDSSIVNFETGKKDLTCNSKEALAKVVGYLSRDLAGIEKITIIGHTDLTGTAEFNEQLAKDRAQEVARYLEQSGIPKAVLAQPDGRSFRQPFGYSTDQDPAIIRNQNATEELKAKNRRVQMNVLKAKP